MFCVILFVILDFQIVNFISGIPSCPFHDWFARANYLSFLYAEDRIKTTSGTAGCQAKHYHNTVLILIATVKIHFVLRSCLTQIFFSFMVFYITFFPVSDVFQMRQLFIKMGFVLIQSVGYWALKLKHYNVFLYKLFIY